MKLPKLRQCCLILDFPLLTTMDSDRLGNLAEKVNLVALHDQGAG